MSFFRPLHRLFSHTSTNLLLSKTFPVASSVKVSTPSPFFYCRSINNYATYTLRSSQSESDSNETETNSWLKSGPIDPRYLKEEEDVVKIKADVPGIGQKDVNVWIEKSVIFIKATTGEVKVAEEEDVEVHDYDKPRCFSGSIEVAEGQFKLDEVRAKVKNGVLEIVIPKKIDIKEKADVN